MEELHPTTEERPWGSFRTFSLNTPSTVKILTVKPGQEFSLQTHDHRSEFWRVLRGRGRVIVGEDTYENVGPGEEFTVPEHTKHRIKAGEEVMEILEISLGKFDENDIERLADDYNRI